MATFAPASGSWQAHDGNTQRQNIYGQALRFQRNNPVPYDPNPKYDEVNGLENQLQHHAAYTFRRLVSFCEEHMHQKVCQHGDVVHCFAVGVFPLPIK